MGGILHSPLRYSHEALRFLAILGKGFFPKLQRLGHGKPGRDAFVYPCLNLIASIPLTSMGAFASHGEVDEPDVGRAL
jgi:hypothetical protein